jgi:hypothetical protein
MKTGTAILVMNDSAESELFITRPIGESDLDSSKDWVVLTRQEYKTALANADSPYGPSIERAWWGAVLHTAKEQSIIDNVENPSMGTVDRMTFLKIMKGIQKEIKGLCKQVQRAKKFREPPRAPLVTMDHVLAYVITNHEQLREDALVEVKLTEISRKGDKRAWKDAHIPKVPYVTVIDEINETKQQAADWLHGLEPNQIRGAILRRIMGKEVKPKAGPPKPATVQKEAKTGKDPRQAKMPDWDDALKAAAKVPISAVVSDDGDIIKEAKEATDRLNKEIEDFNSAVDSYIAAAADEARKRKEAYDARGQ